MIEKYPIFHPDLSRYDEILFDNDGRPINDVNFVQHERLEIASILGSNVTENDNFLPPLDGISEDDAFASFIPKNIQSTDELITYNDYLSKQSKSDG